MAIVNNLPLLKSDVPIYPNDTGKAVEALNEFLQSLPEEQERQDFLTDVGKGYSLLDGNHYSFFSIEAGYALKEYQLKNKERIKQKGQLDDAGFQKEINIVTSNTWSVILEDQGKSQSLQSKVMGETKKESVESQTKSLESKKDKLPDPVKAKNVKEAEFYVKTINPKHRLALRKSPSYERVSKEAAEDVDKKGELVVMMPNDTLLKMIKFGVGFNCEWSQVEVVDEDPLFNTAKDLQKTIPLYCYSEFVQSLSGTAPTLPMECVECVSVAVRNSIFPLWHTLDACEPFYDGETCSYYIVIELKDTSTDDERIKVQKQQALINGVTALLEFYDKQRGEDDVDRYLKSYEFAFVEDYYLDTRPQSKIKFLIRVPAKYFDAIPRNLDFLDDIPNVDTGKLPKDWRTVHFYSSEIEESIDKVSKIIESYDKDVSKWDGEIVGYDFWDEAERLRWFIPAFEWLLEKNKLTLDPSKEDKYEIGFKGPCFEVIYVLASKDMISYPLRIGFNCFKKMEPIKYDRTMGYVFYLSEIMRAASKGKEPWSVFLHSYTCPIPEIRPGKIVKKKKEKSLVYEEKLVKNTKEKVLEDKKISNPAFKKKAALSRKKTRLFVGDNLLSCENIDNLLNSVNSIDDLYHNILNKVDVGTITSFIASCLASKFSLPELSMTMCKAVLNELGFEQLQSVMEFFDSPIISRIQSNTIELQKNKNIVNDAVRLRMSISEIVSENEICKAISSFDPELVFSKMRQLFEFDKSRKYNIPSITMPDNIHTEDIMSAIGETIFSVMKSMLFEMLSSLIKGILRGLCELCTPSFGPEGEKYGDVNLGDVLADSGRGPRSGAGEGGIFSDFDVESNDIDLLRDFLDDLSAMLLPSEIYALLNGTAPKSLLNMIFDFVKTKYPLLLKYFYNTTVIRSFFLSIGNKLDTDICKKIESILEESKKDVLCFEMEDDLRKELLKDKMSLDQVNKQLENIKKRDKDRLQDLLRMLDDNFLEGALPKPINEKNCKEGKKNKIFAEEHSSVDFLNETITESVFNNVYLMFNSDMRNFVNFIVFNGKNKLRSFNSEKVKDALNASRKEINDENKAFITNILANDPLGIGENRGSDESMVKNVVVAKEVKDALCFWKNRHKFGEDLSSSIAAYDFVGQIPMGDELVKLIEKKINVKGMDKLILNEECDEEVFKLAPNTMVRYYLPAYSETDKKMEDYYNILINDVKLKDTIVIEGKNNLEEIIKNFSLQYMKNIDDSVSIQQNLFMNYVTKIWNNVVDNESRKKINDKNSDFCLYFKNDIFHRINVDFINTIALIIGNSELFSLRTFEKIKLIEDLMFSGLGNNVCASDSDNNLLNINDIKNSVKDKNDQLASSCENLTANSTNLQFSSIEKSHLIGIIKTFVRLYVVEYFLRCMFAFSEFKTKEFMNDSTIPKYIIEKIENDLKKYSDGFYDKFLLKIKEYIIDRGVRLVDPLKKDNLNEAEDEILKNELHPKNRSGEAFLEFAIKEEILAITDKFENIFGIDVDEIDNKIFDVSKKEIEFMETSGVPVSSMVRDVCRDVTDDSENKFSFVVAPEVNLGNIKLKKTIMPIFLYINGKIEFEKYVRLINFGGVEVNKILHINDFGSNRTESTVNDKDVCGYLGLRMIYVMPKDAKTDKIMSGIKLNPNAANDNKSFFVDGGEMYCFPLVSVENEEIFSREDFRNGKVNIDKEIGKLKLKIFEKEEYKFLFHYLFSLPRFLSLISIYTMLLTSKVVDNIDDAFENTKKFLRILFRTVTPKKNWWKEKDVEIGNNEELYHNQMNNIKTESPSHAGIAAMTVPIFIKGMAEQYDPAYKLIKQLFDAGMADLGWGDIWKVMPVNIIPLIGFGPPLLPYGAMALSIGLLPGEQRDKERRQKEKEASAPTGLINLNVEACIKRV